MSDVEMLTVIVVSLGILSGILAALNVAQFVFWSRQVQKLVDKLMSRNYFDYENSHKPPSPVVRVAPPEDMNEDLRGLNEYMNL